MVLIKTLNSLSNINFQTQIHKTLKNVINFKTYNNINLLNKLQLKTKNSKPLENSINYILNINFSNTNTLITLSNIKGQPLIFLSGGYIDLKKKQKKTQPLAVINLLKIFIFKSYFLHNQTVAIHFKNVKPYYEHLIIKLLKKVIFLKVMKSSNLQPHNGCRPKKIKRFKQRTKRF